MEHDVAALSHAAAVEDGSTSGTSGSSSEDDDVDEEDTEVQHAGDDALDFKDDVFADVFVDESELRFSAVEQAAEFLQHSDSASFTAPLSCVWNQVATGEASAIELSGVSSNARPSGSDESRSVFPSVAAQTDRPVSAGTAEAKVPSTEPRCVAQSQPATLASARRGNKTGKATSRGSSQRRTVARTRRQVETRCAVCQMKDPWRHESVSCVGCGLTVHFKCYGVRQVDVENWNCDVCLANEDVSCALCPSNSSTECSLALKRTGTGLWVHVSCVLWTPDVSFEDPVLLRNVVNLDSALQRSCAFICSLCGEIDGVCIKCSHAGCDVTFHPQCALAKKLHMKVTTETCFQSMQFEVFCSAHEPPRLYCLCKQPYEQDRFMIGCDGCDEWYHDSCLELDKDAVSGKIEYYCPSCTASKQSSNRRRSATQIALFQNRVLIPEVATTMVSSIVVQECLPIDVRRRLPRQLVHMNTTDTDLDLAASETLVAGDCVVCCAHSTQLLHCSKCSARYHPECLKPPINTDVTEAAYLRVWHCDTCVFKSETFANYPWCCNCGFVGELICCQGCRASFHPHCLRPPMALDDLPLANWFCDYCKDYAKLSAIWGQRRDIDVALPTFEELLGRHGICSAESALPESVQGIPRLRQLISRAIELRDRAQNLLGSGSGCADLVSIESWIAESKLLPVRFTEHASLEQRMWSMRVKAALRREFTLEEAEKLVQEGASLSIVADSEEFASLQSHVSSVHSWLSNIKPLLSDSLGALSHSSIARATVPLNACTSPVCCSIRLL